MFIGIARSVKKHGVHRSSLDGDGRLRPPTADLSGEAEPQARCHVDRYEKVWRSHELREHVRRVEERHAQI